MFSCLDVYLKAHVVVFEHELDHTAPFRESWKIADGEGAAAVQACEDLLQVCLLGEADKHDPATRGIVSRVYLLCDHAFAANIFICHQIIQRPAKWILPEDADQERP